jgi:acetyltransferase-like isoleucine patch superfamily enzyme
MLDPKTPPALRQQILTYHLAELMTDLERAKLLGLPEMCRIRERAKILCQEKLKMGRNVWVGEGAILDAQGGLTIGDNTQIGLNVMIWTHSSHKQAVAGKTSSPTKEGIQYAETKIGSNCFIAGPSVIGMGVTIGDGVIIGPLTFVDKNVADGEVVSTPRDFKKLVKKVEQLEQAVVKLQNELVDAYKDHIC